MRILTSIALLLIAVPVFGQAAASTDEAYQRLQQRQAERAAAATQPVSLADQVAALQIENARLRAIVVDLQLKLAAINNEASATPVAADTDTPGDGVGVRGAVPGATTRAAKLQPKAQATNDRPSNGEAQTGQTATGIPTYTGPRGGQYHYSKSGNKVYEKRK